jgi:hypothetical protein
LSADAHLVLQVDPLPGYTAPEHWFTHLPIVSVYADGRVISAMPPPTIYTEPVIPGLRIQQIPTSDVRRLVDLARAAGVGSGADLGSPEIADAGSIRFSLLTDTGLVQTTAYSLGQFEDQLTPSQRAARKALQDLRDELTDLGRTLGSVPPPTPYTPTAVAAVNRQWHDSSDRPLSAEPLPIRWPGPALPGHYLDQELSCVIASGAAADAVITAAGHANTDTPWAYGGKMWMLSFRPLLPDEASCQDLTG